MDKPEDLIAEHMPYIQQLANKYAERRSVMSEDLVQEGILGLLRATKTYSSDRNVKFLTYASYWIKAYIYSYLKKECRYVPTEDETLHRLIAAAAYIDEDSVLQQDLEDKIHAEAIKIAGNARDLDILTSRYLSDDPCTLNALADQYNITKQRISQIERKLIKRLNKRLKGKFQDDE